MRVALYVRVSSEEQAQHGLSLDAQEAALKDWAEKEGHTVAGIYRDEGISGRKPYTKRPELLRLLSDLKPLHIQLVCFTKLDRWFRNIREYYKVQEILDKTEVKWKAIWEDYETETASGRLKVNIMLAVAQDEADRTAERIRQVQLRQVQKGAAITGKQPFGYMVKIINGSKRVVKDPEEGPILMDCIRWYLQYQSLAGLARTMNEKYNQKHAKTVYRRWITNTQIIGEYKGNTNYCEPYIDRETYDRIQKILKRNIRKPRTKHVYLFSGMLRCPYCGSLMTGFYTYNGYRRKKKDPSHYAHYYRCRSRLEHICDAPAKNIRESVIEETLLNRIADFFEGYRVRYEKKKARKKKEDPQKYIDRLGRLKDLYVLGDISKDEYLRKRTALQTKIDLLSTDIGAAEDARIREVSDILTGDFKSDYLLLDQKHRQAFWRNIIREITLDKDMNVSGVIFL